jgi:hypothetical protein
MGGGHMQATGGNPAYFIATWPFPCLPLDFLELFCGHDIFSLPMPLHGYLGLFLMHQPQIEIPHSPSQFWFFFLGLSPPFS